MNDTLVRLPCARFPLRRALVEITSEALLRADVSEDLFYEAWSKADAGREGLERFESLLRALLRAHGAPSQATIVGVQHDVQHDVRFGRTLVAIEHPSLDAVLEGTELPHLHLWAREREECSVAHLTGACLGYGRRGGA